MGPIGIFQKTSIVGIDLGSSSIKWVRLVRKEGRFVFNGVTLREIPPPGDETREAKTVLALKELLKGVNLARTQFVACVNDEKAVMRVVSVPPMPKAELKEAIKLESRSYFPFSLEGALVEYEMLGVVDDQGIKKMRLAVATAPRETAEGALALLMKAGIKPAAIFPAAWAFHKLAEAVPSPEDQIRCWVDIGERQTELIILKGSRLIFSRKIPVGGRDFTQTMTVALHSERGKTELSLEEAEEIKREVGIPAGQGEPQWLREKISSTQLVSMLRSPLEQLAGEIDRSFNYYTEETGGSKIDILYLFGGGGSLKGLAEALSEKLGMEVKTGNPLEGLKKIEAQFLIPEEGLQPFAAALGATLSAPSAGVNLLPPEIKQEIKNSLVRATFQSIGASALLIAAFIYIGMQIQLANYQKRIEVAKKEMSSLQALLGKVEVQSLASKIMAEEPYWEDIFRELSHLIPSDVYLTEFTREGKKLFLKGVIVSKEKEGTLSDFILNLESGIFKNVKLVTAKERSSGSESEFELEGWVD